jgi:hypothetical protein
MEKKKFGWMDSLGRRGRLFLSTLAQRNVWGSLSRPRRKVESSDYLSLNIKITNNMQE